MKQGCQLGFFPLIPFSRLDYIENDRLSIDDSPCYETCADPEKRKADERMNNMCCNGETGLLQGRRLSIMTCPLFLLKKGSDFIGMRGFLILLPLALGRLGSLHLFRG